MTTLRIHPEYQDETLQQRIGAFNIAAAAINTRRANHAAFVALPPVDQSRQWVDGVRVGEPPQSSIGLATFATAGDVLAFIDGRRLESVALPIEGLALVCELDAIRGACVSAWGTHVAGLRAKLQEAVARAEKEAAGFKGLSAAARDKHVEESTEAERAAVASAVIPEGDTWHAWSESAVKSTRAELLAELQAAVARMT